MGLIATACAIGTVVERKPYNAAWFLALLGLFALNTTACALSRLRFRVRSIGSATVHLSILLIVAGAILRGRAGIDGHVTLQEGETTRAFEARGRSEPVPLGFALRLDGFEVRRHDDGPEALLMKFADDPQIHSFPVKVGKTVRVRDDGTSVQVLKYLPDFRMPMVRGAEPSSASDEPNNPAVLVRVAAPTGEEKRWLFLNGPGIHAESTLSGGPLMQFGRLQGSVDAFESRVTISGEPGRPPRTASLLMNQPLRAGRYVLYQSGYDTETERSSTLQVAYDPGVPLVFAGFILMPLGIAFVFYVQPLLARWRGAGRGGTGKISAE